jgi:ArsR family transcriptional regulator
MTKKLLSKYQARAAVIKAMAHPSRLFIVDLLAKKPHCVGELTEMIEADISTVSKHLSVLKSAGIITDHRDGARIFYELKMPCVLNFFGCVDSVLKESGQELIRLGR